MLEVVRVFFLVFRDEGVVAQLHAKTHHRQNVGTLGAKPMQESFGISFQPSQSKRRRTSHSDTGRPASPSEKLTNQEDTNELKNSAACCILTTPVLVFHHNPLPHCCSPSLMGEAFEYAATVDKKTDRASGENSRIVPLTPDKGTTRPTKKGRVGATFHSSSSCKHSCKSGTARMMRKRTQHEVLHMMLTFFIGEGTAMLSVTLRKHHLLNEEKEELAVRPVLLREIPEAGCRAQSHNIPCIQKGPHPFPGKAHPTVCRLFCASSTDRHH